MTIPFVRRAPKAMWELPANNTLQMPSNVTPIKLYKYVDSMVHTFEYICENRPGAVFRCCQKVTAWGLEWTPQHEGDAIMCPKLSFDGKGHVKKGLQVLELQELDKKTVLVIVKEQVPKKESESRTYGLILDYVILDLQMCEMITAKGMLDKLDGRHFWTPEEMANEWAIIDESLAKKDPPPPQGTGVATSQKKHKKKKAMAGGPGDEVEDPEVKGKGKKQSKSVALTIHRAVNLTEAEVRKLSATELKEINKLYNQVFKPMYKWEKKPFGNGKGELLQVHYKNLHKAPPGVLVYRGIEPFRLAGIKNRILVDADYHSENKYITVLPLKKGPYGPENLVSFKDSCPKKESLTTKTNYYIIGGQHTVQAHRELLESGDIPDADKAAASTFNIIPIWASYETKKNKIMHLSKALNQNVSGEQREQSFTQQLAHARIKWHDMGCPTPSYGGRAHSAAYIDFYQVMFSIFTCFCNADNLDLKILLLFMEKDEDMQRWIQIEKDFLALRLPDGNGPKSKGTRKPFGYTDFKCLCGLRDEDLNYLAGQVEKAVVCMKKTTLNQDSYGKPIIPLAVVAGREKKIRAMKNELMCHYRQNPLPSKKPTYIPYMAFMWDEFESERKITREIVEFWTDKSLTTELGKEWLEGRTKALNKTHDPAECPYSVLKMWELYFNERTEEEETEASKDFNSEYMCRIMKDSCWDISRILSEASVRTWRGEARTHMYLWFLFEMTSDGARAKVLEHSNLRRVFDALEYKDSTRRLVRARSPAVIITDAAEFQKVVCHAPQLKVCP